MILMAYSWCRFTIPRDTLERYAGTLEIYAKTQRAHVAEIDNSLDKLEVSYDAEFAAGAAAALRTIIEMDGETDTDAYVQMVMTRAGGR